ncbi:MAG: hypothetical protein DRH37_01025 [Deltaproteobacteria bacterium]|nr:MAG: hypothetical protein DRH37_01025 [Deltaproteobacteria bacterium]
MKNDRWCAKSSRRSRTLTCLRACLSRVDGRQTMYGRQVIPQIDAGIAEKGHLWMETNYNPRKIPSIHSVIIFVFSCE